MTEILTESFCERCGTRYTFESVAPKQRRMGGIRVLGRGLKNFVLSDDSSLDEAMAAARSDVEREATTQQLDAFHRTFNFCMSCRQYTCGNCWNGIEARCLSCAPMAVAEPAVAAPDAEADLERLLRFTAPAAEAPWPAGPASEPRLVGLSEIGVHVDTPAEALEPPEATLADALEAAKAEAVEATPWVPVEPVAGEPLAVEPVLDAPLVEEPAAEPDEAAPIDAAEVEAEPPLRGLEPGASLDDAIAAYEAAHAETAAGGGRGVDVVEQPTWPSMPVAPEPEAAPVEAAEIAAPEPAGPAPEPAAVEVQPEPAVAAAAPESIELEPAAAAPQPEPEAEPEEPEPVAAAVAEPVPAPEPPAQPQPFPPVAPPPASIPAGPPQWPTGPRWPTGIPARQTVPPPQLPSPAADPLAAIMARQVTEAMWAASSRDVVQPPLAQPAPTAGVQPCISCGISLSATARFCRRCGTSQVG